MKRVEARNFLETFSRWATLAALLWLVPVLAQAYVNVPWVLVGSAASESAVGVVEITPNSSNQAGAMWNPCAIDLSKAFDLTWMVNLGTNQQPCGADGMAFVLQANGTTGILGAGSGEHGYSNGNINKSLAVVLDTFTNTGILNDPSWNSLGIEIDGNDQDAGPSGCTYSGWTSNGTGVIAYSGSYCARPPISTSYGQVSNGLNYTFEAIWDPTTYELTIVTTTPASAPSTQAIWTLPSNYLSTIFGNPTGNLVYYGFTASTGGSTNAQQAALVGGVVNGGTDVNSIACAPSPTPGSQAPPPVTPTYCGSQSPTFTPQGPTATPTITFTPYPLGCAPPSLVGTPLLEEGNPAATNSFAMNIPYQPNELLVVRVSNQNASPVISSITYNGSALTQVMTNVDQQNGDMETWILKAPSFGSSYNLVVNYASTPGESWDMAAMVYQGVNQASPIGATQFTTNSGSPSSFTNSITTTGTNSIIEDFIAVGNGDTYGIGSGQTALYQTTSQTYGSFYQIFGDYRTVLSPGAYNLTYSASYAEPYSSQLIEIKGGAACTTPSPTSTNSPTPSSTNSATASPTASNTHTPTVTNTVTNSMTNTQTATVTQTNTNTLVNTATYTNSPTQTATESLTNTASNTSTVTQTVTSTSTNTVTLTFTDTLINTATVTNSPTNTMTATHSPTSINSNTCTVTSTNSSTAVNSYTPTWTNSQTSTSTKTVTNTATFTMTNTRTSTSTPTPTYTSTATHSPTVTFTFTASFTPTPVGAYTVKVNVYNSAGEVVKTIAIINVAKPITEMDLSSDQITTLQGTGGSIQILFNGALIGSWDGSNNAGDPVSNGTYQIEIDNVGPLGSVTTVEKKVMVNRALSTVAVNIYNSAGERIRTLLQSTANATDSQMMGVVLSTQTLQVGSAGPTAKLQIEVETSGTSIWVSWDGMGDGGQGVSPGIYEISVHWTNGKGGITDVDRQVMVLAGNRQGTVLARPNTLTAGQNSTTFDGTGVPNAVGIRAQVYDLAGQKVAVVGALGSPQVVWNATGFASGIYIAVVSILDLNGNLLYRQNLRVMVLR